MDNLYYKEYYDLERKHWWFVGREKIITNQITKLLNENRLVNKKLKILNIGCSTGRSSEYLSHFGNVTSIEYDKECCEFAIQKTGLEIINGSITELPFDENIFDLVCAFDVIEHVDDDVLAVSEMKRVAKKNGILFVTVPAYMSLWSHHDVINHHFRRYKATEIKNLFKKDNNGIELFSTYFNFFLFLPIYAVRVISNLLKLGKKRKGSGSDFETFNNKILNNFLLSILNLENKLVKNYIKLPFGVSYLFIWRKN